MAHAKTTEPRWVAAAEILATKVEQEIIAIRDEARQNQQSLQELLTMCENFVNTAAEKVGRIKKDIREMVARELAKERALLEKKRAKKRSTKNIRKKA